METNFKIGDEVFDYAFGWGVVTEVYSLDNIYPINVSFYKEGRFATYTNDGRFGSSMFHPTLSHTEYTLDGFSQQTPLTAEERLGLVGTKWICKDSGVTVTVIAVTKDGIIVDRYNTTIISDSKFFIRHYR